MAALMLSTGVFAQRKGFYAPHMRVYVAPLNYGIGFGYPYGYLGYPMFGYPYGYPPYGYAPMSSYSLNRQIASIRIQYRYKIKAARQDKSVSKSERKQDVLSLKSDREKAINNAELNFRKQRMNYRQRMNNNNYYQNPGSNNNPGTNNTPNSGNNNNQNNNNQNSNTDNSQNS